MAGKIPSDPVKAIALLRRVRDRQLAGQLPDPGDAAAFAEMLGRYEAGAADKLTLEEAFRLTPGGSQRPWWHEEPLQARNARLREVACAMYPHGTHIRTMAREMVRAHESPVAADPALAAAVAGLDLPKERQMQTILARVWSSAGHAPDAP